MKLKNIFQIIIFFAYAFFRITTTLPAIQAPRDLADTDVYLRISNEPILSSQFLYVDRPFAFPLLLQLVNQRFETASMIQLCLTIISWGLLARAISVSFQAGGLSLFSFIIILALSLVRHLAGWDFAMMTESLSLSFFALLIACSIWLTHSWKTYKAVICLIIAFIFSFTRDTNAYILLMFAGLILFAIIFRWIKVQSIVFVVGFIAIFFINNLNADLSQRWEFPLINVIGKRILPRTQYLLAFEACGMPLSVELLSASGLFANQNERQFLDDPALEDFRVWISEHGKSCYAKWLISNPMTTTQQALREFDHLIYFEKVEWFFSRKYVDILPSWLERILYPVYLLPWLLTGLTLAAIYGIQKQLWRENPLWSIAILLCLTIFPHLYITWHGDAMAPERHALSVGMQISLSMWLFIFLLIEMILQTKPNIFQRFFHRIIMLPAVRRFFADKTHIMDGFIFKLTKGKHSLSEILGWNIIQINTTGAKTGKLHQLVLLALIDGEKIGVIASNFGRKHYPGWYYNLVKNPSCDVQLNGIWGKYVAREIHNEEYEKYWQMAINSYAGYQKYKERASHRRIPLLILEPVR